MPTNFQVVRVHGHVKWKCHDPGDEAAELTLRRNANHNYEQLDLAEYAVGSPTDEVTTVEFNFELDERTLFWQRGVAGKILVDSHFLLK